jgi:hypothetical protein
MGTVRRSVIVLAGVLGGYGVLHVLGRVSGSTTQERRRVLPGDDLIAAPSFVTNHAATLPAPPDAVWPWMTQVGWHRAGWYTPRWVDRLLFPDNWPSAGRLDEALVRDLGPGDTIPDGPPGTARFVVEQAVPPRLLVLHSTTHLPPGWDQRFGASLDWVWTFTFDPVGADRTRMLVRNRGRVRPRWLDLAYLAAIVPADHIMTRGMFRGLGQRVARPTAGGSAVGARAGARGPTRVETPADRIIPRIVRDTPMPRSGSRSDPASGGADAG